MMRALILTALMSVAASDSALCERLDKRFGAERERGYRAEREFESRDSGFRNKDRANFLGSKQPEQSRPELPRQDLQAPLAIGLQR
ncbi:hypothetical protein RPMA_16400 [Tardiphaga alba]|uniref:Uncharacterized protein n=1 Tax=Tardiphaga alba TaxID=340268 RepID=A0ABX8A931_9BRAD|nr:hypothetical protein [Tardiphaga alba]QUS40238.1 hypothetical protein RPMA_16400 [Tardiphaga alba]